MIAASPFKIKLVCALAIVVGVMTRGGGAAEPLFLRQSEPCMGTKWHIALYADDTDAANAAFSQAWAEIHAIDKCLTNYSAESELSRFCDGSPHQSFISISEHLATVLRASVEMSRLSDSYFDVTIGPVSRLWRRARAKHELPAADRLAAARKRVGWQYIELDTAKRQARLTLADMKIDLGGIAKGYAVDRALAILRAAGVQAALVNGGGDLAAFGVTPQAKGWYVEVAGVEPDSPKQKMLLRNTALATSGDAWQFLDVDGKRFSHLIDPKTGIGSTRRISVSVVAPTCMQADSLASALSVMPVEQGSALVKKLEATEALIVELTESDEVSITKSACFP